MGQFRRQALGTLAALGVALAAAAAEPTLVVELTGQAGAFRVVNQGAPLQLSTTVKVQHQIDGTWRDAPVTNLRLTAACTSDPGPQCLSLATGGTLEPVPWTGNYCTSQCTATCNLDGQAPAGTYRYVIVTCGHRLQFFSEPFEKEGSPQR
jgi:hypothetical protein